MGALVYKSEVASRGLVLIFFLMVGGCSMEKPPSGAETTDSARNRLARAAQDKGFKRGWDTKSKRFVSIVSLASGQQSGLEGEEAARRRRAAAIALCLMDFSGWMSAHFQSNDGSAVWLADGHISKINSQNLSGCEVDQIIAYYVLPKYIDGTQSESKHAEKPAEKGKSFLLLDFGIHRIVYDTENAVSQWRISAEAAKDLEDRFTRSGGEIVAEYAEVDSKGTPHLHCLITWDGKKNAEWLDKVMAGKNTKPEKSKHER